MTKGVVRKPARPGERLHQAIWLGARTRLKWKEVSDLLQNDFDIRSQAPAKSYRKFITSFPRLSVGDFKAKFAHATAESPVMLTFRKMVPRNTVNILGKHVSPGPIKFPGSVFKMKFVLTSGIEPNLELPINRKAPGAVCAITGIQGPGKKYVAHAELVKAFREASGHHWQNFMLDEMISHARLQGLEAVALLRPEHNRHLSDEYLGAHGLNAEEAENSRKQFYAFARKSGLKKVKGSKYFWKFLK